MMFASVILLFLVTLLFTGSYQVYKGSVEEVMSEAMLRTAEESAWHLANFIDGYLAPLEKLASDEVIQSMKLEVQKEVIGNQINPNYENVAVIDRYGKANYLDGTVLDLSERQYIQEALLGKRNLSEIIVSKKTGENVIMAAVPIISKGQVVGALIARLNMTLLLQYVDTRGFGDESEAYIISDNGSKIMVSHEKGIGSQYNLFEQAVADKEFRSIAEFVRTNENNVTGFGSYERAGVSYYACFAEIEDTNWKIYIGTSKEMVLNEIRGIMTLLALGAAVISGIMLGIIWKLIKSFTRPILELEALMERGSRGDFNVHFAPKTEDEIAHLGLSFNRLMETIKTLTYFDPVTLQLNRYVLKKDINALQHSAQNKEVYILMVQVDSLQWFNERYGYIIGDGILKEIADRITRLVPDCGKVYRYKGDSFILTMQEGVKEEDVLELARNMLSTLTQPYVGIEGALEVDFNIGIHSINEKNKHEDPLKSVTDAVLYAKQLGNNQIQKYDLSIHTSNDERSNLVRSIYLALEKQQFFLVYQPLFYLKEYSVAKIEALIRWNHPDKGLVYPNDFIEIAESTEVIIGIDFWVMEEVCKVLLNWKRNHMHLIPISVNITAKTFECANFLTRVEALLVQYEVEPRFIEIEITERMVIKKLEDSILKLESLRAKGMKISIDDFGIGYSSLSYIVQLPIDSIKIDRSFVEQIHSSKQAKAIISTIVNLCKTLELQVVAEGIERQEELDYLKASCCDIGQGYYFSKPISKEEIEKLLNKAEVVL